MRYPDEPHAFVGGVLIHIGAVDMLESLRASGHTVCVPDDDTLTTDGLDDLHEDMQHVIDALEEDLVLLLSLGPLTVH